MSTEARALLCSKILSEEARDTLLDKQQDTFTAGDGIDYPKKTYTFGIYTDTTYLYVYEFSNGFLAGAELIGSCDFCHGRFDRDPNTRTYEGWYAEMEKFIEHDLEWFETESQLQTYLDARAESWNQPLTPLEQDRP
jgi:hypothetical protein